MKLPGLEAVSWIAAIVGLPLTTWLGLRQLKVSQSTATFASLSVFLLVVLLSYAFPSTEEEENPEDLSAPPSGQALPPGEQDTQTRDPGTPTSDQDAPSTPLCRSDYVATPHAPVEVKPCIALVDDQLEISTEVVSEEPAEVGCGCGSTTPVRNTGPTSRCAAVRSPSPLPTRPSGAGMW